MELIVKTVVKTVVKILLSYFGMNVDNGQNLTPDLLYNSSAKKVIISEGDRLPSLIARTSSGASNSLHANTPSYKILARPITITKLVATLTQAASHCLVA